jgi:hypothetical protein
VILEIGRYNFSIPFLKNLSGGIDYMWYCLPPQGRSGGILVGFHSQILKIKIFTVGDRCVKLHLSLKYDNFEWSMVSVYGASQDV